MAAIRYVVLINNYMSNLGTGPLAPFGEGERKEFACTSGNSSSSRPPKMPPSCFEVILVGFILVLPFLYETSRTFRYYFKFLIYYGIVMVNAVLLMPVISLRPGNVKNFLLASSLCHHISALLGLRWELRGREHLEKNRACIIVANHQSSLDILGMFDLWPVMDKCTVVAKKEIFYAWPFKIDLIKGHILVTTLPPISTEGLSTDNVEELIEKTRSAMSEVFHATSREIQQSLSVR
ncbi:1-acyl-sn-glycerol-3-phosphate acyltransferase [Temnothorax longispinosus]|uniref:1-acylglycerol-3-phosphate O-acyltransferase n=1 Tax=Temnothorax longispinosus TaxID=300112 RepID=A0A4V3SCI6_9HYME|nr:1-acyl-sn-glycerol-3-phosphate acyltransferase [Temnothorax longispinosus]